MLMPREREIVLAGDVNSSFYCIVFLIRVIKVFFWPDSIFSLRNCIECSQGLSYGQHVEFRCTVGMCSARSIA